MRATGAASLRGHLVQNLLPNAVSEPAKPEWKAVDSQPRADSVSALVSFSKPRGLGLTLRIAHVCQDRGPTPHSCSCGPKGSQSAHI